MKIFSNKSFNDFKITMDSHNSNFDVAEREDVPVNETINLMSEEMVKKKTAKLN